jgi:WD40 repeat protein
VFGIKHDVRGAVSYLDEASLVFACGHALVRLESDSSSKQQELVAGTPGAVSIDAIASVPLRKLTAVAESYTGKPPTVTIMSWDAKAGKKKRRVLTSPALDLGSDRVVALAFSSDARFLVVQGAEPDYTLAYVSLDKGLARVLAKTRTQGAGAKPVLNASPHPLEPSVVLLSGLGFMKMYRFMDDSLRALSLSLKQEAKRFLAHAWLEDDRFVASTDEGELLVFEHTDFKRVLDSSPSDGRPVDALAPFSKGFLAGADGGRLLLYQRSDDARQYYKLAGEFTVPGDPSRFLSISVSPSEDEAALVLSSGQAYLFRLANFELHKPEDVVFAPMLAPFHGAAPSGDRSVVALATCVRKPIFVSAGADRTIRVWSHLKSPAGTPQADRRPEVELVKRFSEGIHSLALHPSGLHLLVGFESGLQLMNLLMEDIRPVKDLPIRRCTALAFSHGGALFAAANGANVSVYSTYSATAVAKMQGHTDTVNALAWSPDDQFLVTASSDSTVRRWAVRSGGKREHNKVSLKDCVVTSLSTAMSGTDATGALVYATTRNTRNPADSPLFALSFPSAEGTGSVRSALKMGPIMHGHVAAVSGGASVIAATCVPGTFGAIRCLNAPIPAGVIESPTVHEAICHSGAITAMCATPDSRLVITGGDDGSIVLSWDSEMLKDLTDGEMLQSAAAAGTAATLNDRSAGLAPAAASGAGVGAAAAAAASSSASASSTSGDRGGGVSSGGVVLGATVAVGGMRGALPGADINVTVGLMPWAEALLVTRSALQGSRDQRAKLEASVAEVQAQNRYNETYKDMKNEEAMREIEETYREEVDAERRKLMALREEKAELESKFDQQMRTMETAQQQELADLEASYKAKIQAEIERYDDLDRKRRERDAAWDDEKDRMARAQEAEKTDLLAATNDEITAEQRRTDELDVERGRLEEDIARQMREIEGQTDTELDSLKLRYAEKLAKQQKESTQLMFQMTVSRSTRDTLQATKTAQRAKIESLAQAEQVLQETIASLRKDLEGNKKEIEERDETLEEKDARIYDLRKKNQELEKFKFVLNYKIQELQRQIAPRQREIKDMREQTKEMELELLQYHKSNAALDLVIGELKLKKAGLQADSDRIAVQHEMMEERVAEMHRAIHAAGVTVDDPKALKAAATKLYRQFVHADGSMGAVAATEDAQAVTAEHGRKVTHLEQSMDSVRLKLAKDGQRHKSDLERLNKEATVLTREINALRREVQQLETHAAASRAGRPTDVGAPKTKSQLRGTARTMARKGFAAVKPAATRKPHRPDAAAASAAGTGKPPLSARSLRVDPTVAEAEAQALLQAFHQLQRLQAVGRDDPAVSVALRVMTSEAETAAVLGHKTDPKLRAALADAQAAAEAAGSESKTDADVVHLPPISKRR